MRKVLSFILVASCILGIVFAVHAGTRTYNLYLSTSVSGVTTVKSGTSTMIIEGNGISRSQGLSIVPAIPGERVTAIVFQLNDATNADAYLVNFSGSTVTVGFKESLLTGSGTFFEKAGTSVFLTGVALSGDSRVQVVKIPSSGLGDFQFYFTTGVSPFSAVTATVRMYGEEG